MRIERVALVAAVAGLLSQGGCATMGPMGGAHAPPADAEGASGSRYGYSTSRGIQDFAAPPSAVKSAVNEAMDDLNLTVTHRRHDGSVSQIDGRTSDDRTVVVTVRPRQGKMQVSCRIGWFGDDPLSRTFLERVGVRLGTAPPAAIPQDLPSAGLEPDLLPRRHPRLRHATRLRRRSLSGSAGLLSPDRNARQVSRTDSCVPGPAASGISGSGDAAGNGWTGQTARSRLHAIAYFGLPRPARPSIHAESGSGPCGQGARKTIGNRLPDRLATIGRSAAPRILAAWNRPFFSGFILQ